MLHKWCRIICFFSLIRSLTKAPLYLRYRFAASVSIDYVNNFLQPFLADSQQYTHDEFVGLLTATLEQHLVVINLQRPSQNYFKIPLFLINRMIADDYL